MYTYGDVPVRASDKEEENDDDDDEIDTSLYECFPTEGHPSTSSKVDELTLVCFTLLLVHA
jgi:hypothetical protein